MRKTLFILVVVALFWSIHQTQTFWLRQAVADAQSATTIPDAVPLFLPLAATTHPADTPVTGAAWPMVAANPQRTSWTPEEVRGKLTLAWYRPLEPYIPYKVQPIAANGKIYVATARGLYAFNASNGDIAWVYPTALPLGHSPTIATVQGRPIVFVGGYDRRIHAIDANSGQAVAGYTPFTAGAGFETNPLVINQTIYTGNRDGYFYALDAVTGALRWKYQTSAPILFSAAYKEGILYFAANDAHAYALRASNGTLLWQSAKLLGAGFHSYWPVIYTEPATGKRYAIFSGSENYRAINLVIEESDTIYKGLPSSALLGPASTTIAGDWVPGTLAVDASRLTDYFEEKPYRRTVFVLDAANGQEFIFDADKDGKAEYAPFNWSGVTHSGNRYPGVINGVDGVYYQSTGYLTPGWISRGGPVGWKFGTTYISRVDGNAVGHASDEPMAYSAGGKLIYWSLCCDREAGAIDVTIPYGQPDRAWQYYGYNLANNQLAPGYQVMYDDGNTAAYNNLDGWQLYSGKQQSKNGIYGKHGTTQSPPIPYQGKLYLLKGNALLAFSPTGTSPKTPLPLAKVTATENDAPLPTPAELRQRLETEIQKMLAAGPLRPGYHAAGFIDLYGNGAYTDEQELGEIFDYFQNPADTVYTLLLAYPHLTVTSQQQVKKYLETNYGPGAPYDFTQIVHIGWGTGAARELYDIPPEVLRQWGQPYNSPLAPSTQPTCGSCGYWRQFPPFSFYAAWQYAQIIGNGDPAFAKAIFDQMSGKLEAPLADALFVRKPYWLNLYLAGYQGYLALQQLAGYPQDQTVLATYQHLLDLRVNHFMKDVPYPTIGSNSPDWAMGHNNALVGRNFIFLTPELGAHLHQHLLPKAQAAIAEYETVAPYWFVAKFDHSYGEGTLQPLYDYPALFQAKAYILKASYADLAPWLDVPAFARGDLFYLQNLVAALRADAATPVQAVATENRRVNLPNLTGVPYAPAIFWLGKVTPTTNYADVRALYYDTQVRIILHIVDRRLWFDPAPTAATLTEWDAVSIVLKLDGNQGDTPTSKSYRFVKQLNHNDDNATSQAAYQGDGTAWLASQTAFTATSTWRGNNPNDDRDDKGWSVTFIIPFTSLGLAAAPSPGALWGLGVAVHDRDAATAATIPDQLWPASMDPLRPQSWGQLRFTLPTYKPPAVTASQEITIREGLRGATVADAHVGGHTICGETVDHWSAWGETSYGVYDQINIQNQWDISDYPCFSKYYVTFPLAALPANQRILSATVTLYLFGNAGYEAGQAKPSAIQALVVGEDWDEQTLTWNNAPLPVENLVVTWVEPIDFFDPGVPYTWDVSRAVATAYQQGQPLRLAFYSTDGDYHSGKYFWSSEAQAAVRPQLQVRYGR
jgi:hypothetical protein